MLVNDTDLRLLVVPTAWSRKVIELVEYFGTPAGGAGATAAKPLPDNDTPTVPALVAYAIDAVRDPDAVGRNPTAVAHAAPGESAMPAVQVPDTVKSPGLASCTTIDESVSAAVPLLTSVTDCVADVLPTMVDAKTSAVGVSAARGASAIAATPLPARTTKCGLPLALVTIEIDALRAPAPTGEKRTWIWHDVPGASDPGQL